MTIFGVLGVLLVLVNVGRLHDSLFQYTGAVPAGKILLATGLVGFLLTPPTVVLGRAFRTPQAKALIAFTVSIFLSIPFSLLRSDSLEVATDFILASVPIMLITVAGVSRIEDLERLFKAAVVMVILAAVLIGAGFGVVFYGPDGPRTTLQGEYDPNDLAMVIATAMAFCVWATKDPSKLWRALGYVGLVGGAYVVGRTYSRGGSLALGTLILLSVFALRDAVPKWFRAVLVPLALVGFLLSPSDYRARIQSIGQEDYNQTADAGRIAIWKRGVKYFLKHPITGVGAGQFSVAEGNWGSSQGRVVFKWSAPHNMYVESAAELGILGIGGLLGVLLPTIRRGWRLVRGEKKGVPPSQEARAAGALFLAICTFMVGAMFLTAMFSPMFMFLAALAISAQSLTGPTVHGMRTAAGSALATRRRPQVAGGRVASRWTGRAIARTSRPA